MNQSKLMLWLGAAVLVSSGTHAAAYEIRQRFVHRIGTNDMVIDDVHTYSVYAPNPGTPIRIRLQFGVFDSASGPAPEGGLIGWTFGNITLNNPNQFTATRTPGRLSPFNFAPSPNANGVPIQDPFSSLTNIDNILGTQVPVWPAGSDPDMPPQPIIRGLNTFVSVYEITLSTDHPEEYPGASITFSGNQIAAQTWLPVGTPNPPTPDEPGSITYAPFPLAPIPFSRTLGLLVIPEGPSPSSGVILVGAVLVQCRRRRR